MAIKVLRDQQDPLERLENAAYRGYQVQVEHRDIQVLRVLEAGLDPQGQQVDNLICVSVRRLLFRIQNVHPPKANEAISFPISFLPL